MIENDHVGLTCGPAAIAAAAVITELRPRGAEIGRPFTLTAIGRNLGDGAKVISMLPASFTLVQPAETPGAMRAPGGMASFLVEPRPDAAPGVYPVRIDSPSGISNVLLLRSGIRGFRSPVIDETSRLSAGPAFKPS